MTGPLVVVVALGADAASDEDLLLLHEGWSPAVVRGRCGRRELVLSFVGSDFFFTVGTALAFIDQ